MNKRHLISLLLVSALVVAGGSTLLAKEQTTPAATPPAQTVDHSAHGAAAAPAADPHAGHAMDAAGGSEQPAGHDMGHMTKQQEAITAHMATLRSGMETIKASTNPEERKKLMIAHLAAMTQGLKMLQELGHGAMMQGGMCPMMQKMQHGPGQGGMMMGQGCGKMGMGMGHKGMAGMGMCHAMMQQKAELSNGLLEQLIEMQGQLLTTGR